MRKLLLLHGALGSKDQFNELTRKLNSSFEVHAINFSCHGGKDIPGEPFSMEMFANDIELYLTANNISEIDIFGYSMGGYAALYSALRAPGRIRKIFTLATKFEWTPEIAEREVKMLDAVKIKEKVPKFASELAKRHGEGKWETVLKKTAEMMEELGRLGGNHRGYPLKLENINSEVLIGIGDRDKMVSLEETISAYRSLANGKLIVFPDTPHEFIQTNIDRMKNEMINFLN
ncbi:MAG: alpha/beta hydrolase [Ignavibacteria bacterium]